MKWAEMSEGAKDRLIHEKVMQEPLQRPCPGHIYWQNDPLTNTKREYWYCEYGHRGIAPDTKHLTDAPIPDYTQSMDAAWLVLQKIASRYSEQSQWLVDEQFEEFVDELCECSGNEIYPATKFFVRMAAWTPDSICLIALKVCGWKEGKE